MVKKYINISVYTHVGGSPKNKVKTFTPVSIWRVLDLTIIDDKYYSLLKKIFKKKNCSVYYTYPSHAHLLNTKKTNDFYVGI